MMVTVTYAVRWTAMTRRSGEITGQSIPLDTLEQAQAVGQDYVASRYADSVEIVKITTTETVEVVA